MVWDTVKDELPPVKAAVLPLWIRPLHRQSPRPGTDVVPTLQRMKRWASPPGSLELIGRNGIVSLIPYRLPVLAHLSAPTFPHPSGISVQN
jgi:hypothetical protein